MYCRGAYYFTVLDKWHVDQYLKIDDMTLALLEKYDRYVDNKNRQTKTGRTARKDSTKGKTYKAEWQFEKTYSVERFESLEQAQKFLDRVIKSKTWAQLDQVNRFITIELMRDRSRIRTAGLAHYNGRIQLCPRTGLSKYVLLHELAHQAGHMHHDIEFRKCLLRLVSRFMGRDKAAFLKQCFKDQGLKMSIKTTIKSPERWLHDYFKMQSLRQLRTEK